MSGGRKNTLKKFKNIIDGDMSQATLTSAVTNIQFLDSIGLQLSWTGAPVGSFEIQISADYEQDDNGNVLNAGHWIPLALTPSPTTAVGSPIFVDITLTAAPWIRVVYTRTSGSGVLNSVITAKQV